ncbi:MAG: FAD:protein FMN transferase [Nitrospirae bacterium]|nr:FAD:protein FMN transferase [Nitrospirota bacterium]
MGTTVTITVVAASEPAAGPALDAAFAEVAAMERMFSSYRTDSDLSRLNALAGQGPQPVPAPFAELVAAARDTAALTGGAFNPMLGPAIKLWGIPENPAVPDAAALDALRPLLDPAGITVDVAGARVTLARPGMALGLGGIAKGFTADRVQALLRGMGVGAGIVAVAGDIRVWGTRPDGTPWRIGVRDPDGGHKPRARLALTAGAVSTSGDYERFFELDGVRYHHILDPRTLFPARGVRSVTVLAPTGTRADGLATALFVMGVADGLALVETLPGVEALYIAENGAVTTSAGWPGT